METITSFASYITAFSSNVPCMKEVEIDGLKPLSKQNRYLKCYTSNKRAEILVVIMLIKIIEWMEQV